MEGKKWPQNRPWHIKINNISIRKRCSNLCAMTFSWWHINFLARETFESGVWNISCFTQSHRRQLRLPTRNTTYYVIKQHTSQIIHTTLQRNTPYYVHNKITHRANHIINQYVILRITYITILSIVENYVENYVENFFYQHVILRITLSCIYNQGEESCIYKWVVYTSSVRQVVYTSFITYYSM